MAAGEEDDEGGCGVAGEVAGAGVGAPAGRGMSRGTTPQPDRLTATAEMISSFPRTGKVPHVRQRTNKANISDAGGRAREGQATRPSAAVATARAREGDISTSTESAT
ncbi:hypothetical protein GCM10010149_20070 [Nonomuraea roseoviolacea subsp. roseoviolacea]